MKAYERLIRYASFPTASDENIETCPSTESQRVFANALAQEMRELGLEDVSVDENGYCFGSIPSNIPGWNETTVGFIAHMDVVRDVPFENIQPRVIEGYDGGTVRLESGDSLDPAEFPFLSKYKGKTLIVTGGDTLLGADDKAGVAEILTFAEYCKEHPEYRHGKIAVGFTPDEEIGRGADKFNVEKFGARFAYTVDGGGFGEVEYETFNAASAIVTFTGRNIHPGAAKGKMISAARIGCGFDSLLPCDERPENTEGYEGFYHLISMQGEVESARLAYILRDHDAEKLELRKARVLDAAKQINEIYGEGTAKVEIRDSYRNMKEALLPHMHLIENAKAAVRKAGGEPVSLPVRGGTDGSRLSFMGLPCPNLGTGSHNHHGKMEFACAEEMEKCAETLRYIAESYA